VKRVDITSAANDATAQLSTPSRSRTATGGFAKQLKRATSKGTIQPVVTADPAPSTSAASSATTSPPTPAPDQDVADATHCAAVISRPIGRGLVSAATRAAKQQLPQPQLQPQPQPQPQPQIAAQQITIPAPTITVAPATIEVAQVAAPQVAAAAPEVAPVVDDSDDDQPPIATTAAPAAPAVDDTSTDAAPRTPLEQAVHDLLSQLGNGKREDQGASSRDDDAAGEQAAAQKLAATAQTVAPAKSESFTPAAPAAPVAPPDAQQLQSAHHAHIVIGDDADRIVMTVAVRGSAVNVTLKASDDHTAAALARNAGSLDNAMRQRGLDLDQFETPREAPRERQRQQYEQPQRAKPESDSTEPFELEEQV
jgi:hypothetical protein